MAINVPIVSEWEPTGLKKAVKDFEKLETTGQKVGFALEKAFLPATAAVAGLTAAAGLSLKAAAEDAEQQAELARTIQVSTDATLEQVEAVESFIQATELASAVSDSELRPALAILTRHTGDLTEAQDLLTLALDISAGTGRDVFDVSERLAEGYTGVLTPLEELDYGLVQAIENGATFDDVASSLADTFEGAVATNAETAAGQFARMQVQIQNTQEAIGMALMPILDALLPVLESAANFVANNTEVLIVLGGAIGSVSAAIIILNGVLKAWNTITVITNALNKALSLSFTTLQVASGVIVFTALVAVFIALQKRFNIIGKVIAGLRIVFDKLSDAVKWLASKFVDFVNTLIDVANKIPFVEIGKIKNVFDDTSEATNNATAAVELMKRPLNDIRDAFSEAQYQAQLANVETETARQLMDELHPTSDDVTAAISRQTDALDSYHEAQEFINAMNTELIDQFDKLFGRFDNDEVVRNFADAIDDATEAIDEYGEGSREAIEASEDMYRALGDVITQLDNIPATKQLELLAALDRGEYEQVLREVEVLANMANTALTYLTAAQIQAAAGMVMPQSGFQNIPTASSSVEIGGGAGSVPTLRQGSVTSPMQVIINQPAGTDPQETARVLERAARQGGTLPIATTGAVRS